MNLRNVAAGTAACLALSSIYGDANAQSRLEQLPDIVVTADRAPEPIGSTGSGLLLLLPRPSWPMSPRPQQRSEPSVRRAQLW